MTKIMWIVTLGLAACAPVARPVAMPMLDGTEWAAEDIGGGGIIDNARVTAKFEKGRIGGRSGCNTYNGSYVQDGSKLSIGPTASTMMACAPALMNLERQYLGILQGATSVRIDATGALIITGSGGATVLLRKAG